MVPLDHVEASYEAGIEQVVQQDGHDHTHDPATKNALSRASDPQLTTVRVTPERTRIPATRYALAGGCYTLAKAGEAFRFRAMTLGSYLIIDRDQRFFAADGSRAARPAPTTEWSARLARGRHRPPSGVPGSPAAAPLAWADGRFLLRLRVA